MRKTAHTGFTLIEVMLLLLLLAIFSTVALRSTVELTSQSRYDDTNFVLESVEEAVLGTPGLVSFESSLLGNPEEVSEGFIADLGRPPLASGNDPGGFLAELWSNPFGLERYGVGKHPQGDGSIRALGGWRGNYFPVSPGQFALKDGWGRDFIYLNQQGNPVESGEPIYTMMSLGADNAIGGVDFDADRSITFGDQVNDRFHGTLRINVAAGEIGEFGDRLVVRVYGPDPATGGAWTEMQVHAGTFTPGEWDDLECRWIPKHAFVLEGTKALTVGPKIVRAYQRDGSEIPNWQAVIPEAEDSDQVAVMILAGQEAEVTLIVPKDEPCN